VISNQITRNPLVWGSLLLCTGLILGAVYIPALAAVLSIVPPTATAWLVVLAASLLPLAIGQIAVEWSKVRR
jgi:Ca2+-transporting ATPase